jgi:ABC-type multidrug transport system permease subunit
MGFYWNIGAENKKDQLFKNYMGFFFNNVNQFFINGMYTALFAIPVVKNILKREYSAKLYRISTFFLAYIIASLINSLMYAIIFTPITFFSTNLLMQSTEENLTVFSTFFCLDFSIYTLGQFFGLLLGGSLPEHVCFMVSPLMFILFMLGAGVYRGNSSLPNFVSWLFYISPYKYFLELELKNFKNFNEITKRIPDLLQFNYGLEVCIPALIGTMMTVLILGYFGIRSYSAKF